MAIKSSINRITFIESNNSQNYATHGFFRYFGKLPPVVINHILDIGLEQPINGPVVDIMCGSGTSIVECMRRGIPSIGVDVNPISTLISDVKTTIIPIDKIMDNHKTLQKVIERDLLDYSKGRIWDYFSDESPFFFNKDYWFTNKAQKTIVCIKHHIDNIDNDDLRKFFLLGLISILRKVSNASPRAGRIFHIGQENQTDVLPVFNKKIQDMIEGIKDLSHSIRTNNKIIIRSDAMHTGLRNNMATFIIAHPPYFALYKYSSDVLRFELEWTGVDRKQIVKTEIRDGFKTTELDEFTNYISDMQMVFIEAYRILNPNHLFCLIVNNSTLRDTLLPCVDNLINAAEFVGFKVFEHQIREINFSQASYHRSARADKKTKEDHLIFFRKP